MEVTQENIAQVIDSLKSSVKGNDQHLIIPMELLRTDKIDYNLYKGRGRPKRTDYIYLTLEEFTESLNRV